MSFFAFVLVVIAAFSHAAWNLVSKKASASGFLFIWLGALTSTVLYAPLAVVDVSLNGLDLSAFALGVSVSAVLHLAYMLVLQRGYAAADISVVYPMARGTGPLLTVVFAIALFGERPPPLAILGAFVIVLGVVGIAVAGASTRRHNLTGAPQADASTQRARMQAGILYGLLTGAAIASYTLWDAHVVMSGGISPLTFMVGCTFLQAVILAPSALRQRRRLSLVWSRFRREALLFGLLSPLSYILVLWAMQLAPVSLVAPARELSVVLVSLAGWLIYKEPNPVQRLGGAVVVVSGVALLALS